MKKYNVYYKCRLCCEVIDMNVSVDTKEDAVTNIKRAVQFADLKTHPYLSDFSLDLIQIHNCGDGSVGITDFQGFKLK